MTTTNMTCPYCEQTFQYSGYTADKDLSTHKATCTEKRFLGGTLVMEEFAPQDLDRYLTEW